MKMLYVSYISAYWLITSCCLCEKVKKVMPCSEPGPWEKTEPLETKLLWPFTSTWPTLNILLFLFFFSDTAALPFTLLSTKPLNPDRNKPRARPLLLVSAVEDHKNVHMLGLTFFSKPSMDSSFACHLYQYGHLVHARVFFWTDHFYLIKKKRSTNSSVNMFEADVSMIFTSLISTRQ